MLTFVYNLLVRLVDIIFIDKMVTKISPLDTMLIMSIKIRLNKKENIMKERE